MNNELFCLTFFFHKTPFKKNSSSPTHDINPSKNTKRFTITFQNPCRSIRFNQQVNSCYKHIMFKRDHQDALQKNKNKKQIQETRI